MWQALYLFWSESNAAARDHLRHLQSSPAKSNPTGWLLNSCLDTLKGLLNHQSRISLFPVNAKNTFNLRKESLM